MVKITNIPFDALIPSTLTVENWKKFLIEYPRTNEELLLPAAERAPLKEVVEAFNNYKQERFMQLFDELSFEQKQAIQISMIMDSETLNTKIAENYKTTYTD